MEITGTIVNILPAEQGVSKNGKQWSRQTVVISYGEQYPKELALNILNDNVQKFAPMLTPNAQLKFFFDVSSREFNGRYYTECIAWKVENPFAQQAFQPSQPFGAQPAYQPQRMQTAFQQPQQAPQPTAYEQSQMLYNKHTQPFGNPATVTGTDELLF